jgi:hypothetical protein
MTRAIALSLALAATGCKKDRAAELKAVPLSKAPETRGLLDAGVKKAREPDPPPVAEEPDDAVAEVVLPPGKEWRSIPGLGVDVAVAPEVTMRRGRGDTVLADDLGELHIKRGAAGTSAAEVQHRLEAEGGSKLNVVVDHSEGDDFRLEYVTKDRKSGAPIYGLAMRRVIDGVPIDCASRGFATSSTRMAFDACRVMRATPR